MHDVFELNWNIAYSNSRYSTLFCAFQYGNPYVATFYRGDMRQPTAPHSVHLVGRSQHQQDQQLSTTNIYIRALGPETKDEDLEDLCKQYGEISSVKAIIDKNTGDCKGQIRVCSIPWQFIAHCFVLGYGFVDFVSQEDAKKAVEQLKQRSMQAQFAKLTANDPHWKRQQEADPTNLYLQNLPKTLDEKVWMYWEMNRRVSLGMN